MSISIETKIEKAHYMASEHDVEMLSAAHLSCSEATQRVDGSYLRILIAAVQARFGASGRGRRKAADGDLGAHSTYLASVHTRLYPFVLRGITTPDVADDEALSVEDRRARGLTRSSRAGFARSAASTLQTFVRAGGDIRGLDVETATKSALRAWAKAQGPGKPYAEVFQAAFKRVEREASALAADDPDAARVAIEDCMTRLQAILDDLSADRPTGQTITQTLRSRPVHTRQPAPQGRAHA